MLRGSFARAREEPRNYHWQVIIYCSFARARGEWGHLPHFPASPWRLRAREGGPFPLLQRCNNLTASPRARGGSPSGVSVRARGDHRRFLSVTDGRLRACKPETAAEAKKNQQAGGNAEGVG